MPLIPDENLRLFLAGELASRKQRNPAYSLRAFARRLQMSPSFLSEVLKGKKAVSHSRAEQLRTMLAAPDDAPDSVSTNTATDTVPTVNAAAYRVA